MKLLSRLDHKIWTYSEKSKEFWVKHKAKSITKNRMKAKKMIKTRKIQVMKIARTIKSKKPMKLLITTKRLKRRMRTMEISWSIRILKILKIKIQNRIAKLWFHLHRATWHVFNASWGKKESQNTFSLTEFVTSLTILLTKKEKVMNPSGKIMIISTGKVTFHTAEDHLNALLDARFATLRSIWVNAQLALMDFISMRPHWPALNATKAVWLAIPAILTTAPVVIRASL